MTGSGSSIVAGADPSHSATRDDAGSRNSRCSSADRYRAGSSATSSFAAYRRPCASCGRSGRAGPRGGPDEARERGPDLLQVVMLRCQGPENLLDLPGVRHRVGLLSFPMMHRVPGKSRATIRAIRVARRAAKPLSPARVRGRSGSYARERRGPTRSRPRSTLRAARSQGRVARSAL
jgi:hypothetical protein